jgi:hypothetical protein
MNNGLENLKIRALNLAVSAKVLAYAGLVILLLAMFSLFFGGTSGVYFTIFMLLTSLALSGAIVFGLLWFQATNFLYLAESQISNNLRTQKVEAGAKVATSTPKFAEVKATEQISGDKVSLSKGEKADLKKWFAENPSEFVTDHLTAKEFLAWERAGSPSLNNWIDQDLPAFDKWLASATK